MSANRKIISGVIGLSVIFLAVWAVFAQDSAKPAAAPEGESTKIAILDVNKIFKENAAFKKAMDQLKDDADGMGKKMKEEEATLKSSAEKLKDLTVGSTEYTELESSIAREKADFTIRAGAQRRVFLQREANTYRLMYRTLSEEVEKYARENQIALVLRYMSDPVDEKNPDSILADINKPVVYHDKSLDITPAILKIMETKEIKLD